jgi:hypothetical protein
MPEKPMQERNWQEFEAVLALRPDHPGAQQAVAAIRRKLN